MQVTIDLPDDLAEQANAESSRLSQLLVRALRPKPTRISPLRSEVLSFFARGPQPSEIVAFRPSEVASAHMSELLERSRLGKLTPADEAEMDEIEEIDNLISLIKAEAHKHIHPSS